MCGTANAGKYDVFTLRLASLFALRLAREWSDTACSRSEGSKSTLLMDFCSVAAVYSHCMVIVGYC